MDKHLSGVRASCALAILAAAVISVVGCSTSGGGPGPVPATLDDAWDEFEAGHYAAAIATFHEVLSNDGTLTDALNGLGWSFAHAGTLDSALHYYEMALSRQPTLNDAAAGLSAVHLALGDAASAIVRASAVLADESGWAFVHRSGINHEDLRLILAQGYFAQGGSDLTLVQDQVDILDPSNLLDPTDPESWDGYPSYTAALLRTLQDIEERVGAELMF